MASEYDEFCRPHMNREDFSDFVASMLDEVIQLAEEKCGQELSRKVAFRWLGHSDPDVSDNIVEHIVGRVFVDEEHIFPCVDMGVGDIQDGTLLIVGSGWLRTSAVREELDRPGWAVRSHCGSAILEQNGRGKRHLVAWPTFRFHYTAHKRSLTNGANGDYDR